MTHSEIEAFLAVCRHRKISKAAEELFVSQSSLSIRLKTLEEDLGCPLLQRGKGKREIALTTQGQAFYSLALQYQNIIQKMETVGKGNVLERLHVSAINSVGNHLMPPIFERFTEKYPHIHLTVQDMEAEMACASILRGKTDLAFSTANVQTDQIMATPFLADPMTVLHSADLKLPDLVDLEMLLLSNEVYIKWSAEYAYWHRSVFGADFVPQIELELMGQIELFVSKPDKWAFVPKSVADNLCCTSDLRQSTPAFPIPARTLYMLRHRDNAETANICCFLDILREVLLERNAEGLLL